MRFGIRDRRNHHDAQKPPRLVPTGSFDKVLLTGGKNLTTFQSVALIITGFGVALGAGVPIIVMEHHWESEFARYGYSGNSADKIVGSVIILWGIFMIFNGSRGIVRQILKRSRV
jgi:hypothetical protein